MKYTNKIKDTLKLGDIVIFNIKGVKYEYKVKECYLYYLVGFPNDVIFTVKGKTYEYQVKSCFCDLSSKTPNNIIFTKLNLNAKDFCTKHYGYQPYDGFWPECKGYDFEALTRVVNALYDEINKNPLPDNLFTLD
jgi:hypothetical protein